MKLIKRTAVLLILFPLIGSIFSCLFFLARMRGTFTKWEMLGKPTTTPVKLLQMGYVQTVTGDIYQFQSFSAASCTNNCWVMVNSIPQSPNTTEMLPLEDCQSSFDLPSVHRFSDSIIECWRWGPGIRVGIQAIDRNGNIQSWHKGIDDFGDPLLLVTSPILGGIGGFVVALLFFVLALIRGLIIYWPHQRRRSIRKSS